jgi:hypothetical protein
MGREARCTASWGTRSGEVTVHLDAAEISVRGAFRARAPLTSLRDVRAEAGVLRFRTADNAVALDLGRAAPRWATALLTPPPSLATKLGIRPGTRVAVSGAIDDAALADAIAAGQPAGDATAEVIVARVDDAAVLARILDERAGTIARRVPIWVVYVKGRGAPLGEAVVRDVMRGRGLIDVKVAAVSARLTALQFVPRVRDSRPGRIVVSREPAVGGKPARRGSAAHPRDREGCLESPDRRALRAVRGRSRAHRAAA